MNERSKQENKKPLEHSHHAIGRAQYDKSLGDLTEKMGMQDYKEALP